MIFSMNCFSAPLVLVVGRNLSGAGVITKYLRSEIDAIDLCVIDLIIEHVQKEVYVMSKEILPPTKSLIYIVNTVYLQI